MNNTSKWDIIGVLSLVVAVLALVFGDNLLERWQEIFRVTPIAMETATPFPAETSTLALTDTLTVAPTLQPTPAPDLYLPIAQYRLAEKEAVEALQPDKIAQLSDFATGEALELLQERVTALINHKQYQYLTVSRLEIKMVIFHSSADAVVLMYEIHNLQTYQTTDSGSSLIDQDVHDGDMIYGLRLENGVWKVEKVRQGETQQEASE